MMGQIKVPKGSISSDQKESKNIPPHPVDINNSFGCKFPSLSPHFWPIMPLTVANKKKGHVHNRRRRRRKRLIQLSASAGAIPGYSLAHFANFCLCHSCHTDQLRVVCGQIGPKLYPTKQMLFLLAQQSHSFIFVLKF